MTLQEINNLTWFDLINKLKSILKKLAGIDSPIFIGNPTAPNSISRNKYNSISHNSFCNS